MRWIHFLLFCYDKMGKKNFVRKSARYSTNFCLFVSPLAQEMFLFFCFIRRNVRQGFLNGDFTRNKPTLKPSCLEIWSKFDLNSHAIGHFGDWLTRLGLAYIFVYNWAPTMWYVWPATAQISLHIRAVCSVFANRLNILRLLSYWPNGIWSF